MLVSKSQFGVHLSPTRTTVYINWCLSENSISAHTYLHPVLPSLLPHNSSLSPRTAARFSPLAHSRPSAAEHKVAKVLRWTRPLKSVGGVTLLVGLRVGDGAAGSEDSQAGQVA